ncbi:angio-associated migratory cell protein isoform X1 [Linepithema humile]|nr:PREDICTED: angio-associated migratory cell protein [Linepithema humile]
MIPPPPPEMNPILDEEMILGEEDVDEIIDMGDIEKVDSSSEDESGTFSGHDILENDLPRDDAMRVYCPYKPEEDIKHSIFSCSLSKNGELAVIGDENDRAYVFNIITGEIIIDCGLDHKDSVIFTEFNYNDKYVATADMSGVIQLWQISNKSCIWSTNLYDDITWVKWHHSANVLLVSVASGEIHILKIGNIEAHKIIPRGYGNGDVPFAGVILADGKRAALGYRNGTICVIDLKVNKVLSTTPGDPTGLHGHSDTIIALDCHTDDNLLISISQGGKTMLSTAHNGKIISILQDLNSNKTEISEAGDSDSERRFSLEAAAFCKDPTFPVAATGIIDYEDSDKGRIYIWDVSRQVLRHEIKQEAGVTRLVWTNTSIFFTGGLDGILRCFDAKAGCHLRSFLGHTNTILDLHISCEGKKVVTSSDDGTARIFDISSLY